MAVRSVVGESEGFGRSRFSMLAANPFADHGEFYPIATVTVGSGGASSIEFTSIPSGFQHLQVRMLARCSDLDTYDDSMMRFNGDTGSNYRLHALYGDGSSAAAYSTAQRTEIAGYLSTGANAISSVFAATIFDILDYASTSKNKTVRMASGFDNNGTGAAAVNRGVSALYSGLWMSTAAITSITFFPTPNYTWSQHSTAALYGVRA